MMNFFHFLLISLALTAVCQAQPRILINGVPYSDTTHEFLLKAGSPNELAIERAPGEVELIRKTAGGLSLRERKGSTADGRVVFALGPMAAPPAYDYEAGALYVRGYTLTLLMNGRTMEFRQVPAAPLTTTHPYPWWSLDEMVVRPMRFQEGGPARTLFDLKSASPGLVSLRLGEKVMDDQNALEIETRLNKGETPAELPVLIRVSGPAGKEVWSRRTVLAADAGWTRFAVDPKAWPAGSYRVELLAANGDVSWKDGAAVNYHRRAVPANELLVSPLAPWTLERDPSREEIVVRDFRDAHRRWGTGPVPEAKYGWREGAAGSVALEGRGDADAPPVVLRLPVKGSYAVFAAATGREGAFVQAGPKGLVRFVRENWRKSGSFLEAGDLTAAPEIRIYGNGYAGGALTLLRLVPVTAASVRRFYSETRNPPTPLYAINDWADNFGTDGSMRIKADQFEAILCTESEIGLKRIGWSVGRSWVEYHSALPNAKTFPCVPYDEARKKPGYPKDTYDYSGRIWMMERFDPLDVVNGARGRCQAEVWPWLAMQRHYGTNFYGGLFACPFYRDNQQWWRYSKSGSHAAGLSYFFPEVRKDRVDILMETAERGADGVVVGCDRQVPMLLYDPAMVEAYRARTGVDARKIDASNKDEYDRWIRWRADFFTEVLRDLKRRLEPLRAKLGRPIPVSVRLPSSGLYHNLAQGMDIEQWCKEGLLDRMQLDPLEEMAGKSRHDVRPYQELARKYQVQVIGGIGSTGYLGGDPMTRPSHVVPGLRRALGLLQAGVDGVDTYETNGVALNYEERFIVPLFGNRARLEKFLAESNLEACYPVDAGNAAAGHDNHSRWDRGWDIFGFGHNAY